MQRRLTKKQCEVKPTETSTLANLGQILPMPTIRLIKVANLLSLPTAKIVDYLATQGHEVRHSPLTKITEEQYILLKVGFPDEFDRARGIAPNRNLNPAPRPPAPPPIPRASSSIPPPPPSPFSLLRNLKITGSIDSNESRRRAKILSVSRSKYPTTTTPPDFNLDDKKALYLGFVCKDVFDKGFGFIRQIGGRTDIWFHLTWVQGEPVKLGELVVFTVGKSEKHAGKLEAPSVKSYTDYSPTPESLQAWYHMYQNSELQQELFSKMTTDTKTVMLKQEIDKIKVQAPEQITSAFQEIIKTYFSSPVSTDLKEHFIDVTDTHISNSGNATLQFYWWLANLGDTEIPQELIVRNMIEGGSKFQLEIFNRASEESHLSLIESIFPELGISGLLNLKSEALPSSLVAKLDPFIKVHLSHEEEAELFFADKWDQIDLDNLLSKYRQLSSDQLYQIIRCVNNNTRILKTFLADLIQLHLRYQSEGSEDIIKQLSLVLETIKKANSDLLPGTSAVIEDHAPKNLRRQLWEAELLSTATTEEKENWLIDDNFTLATLESWKSNSLIDHPEYQSLLQFLLSSFPVILSRPQFYTFHELLTKLQHKDNTFRVDNQIFFDLSLWLSDPDLHPLSESLNQKLNFLEAEHQILMLKKRFHLHETGVKTLSIDDLQQLRHIDLSLYQTAAEVAPELNLDLSIATVIHTLKSLADNAKLLVTGDLIGIMLENITGSRAQKFKITGLFEPCAGRMEMVFNWGNNDRKLSKVYFNESYYWALQVAYGDSVIDDIRNFPTRKWNPDERHWGVPKSYETDVLALARDNNFFIDIEGSNYKNNTHLATAKRTQPPRGITYCEGRRLDNLHYTHKKEFWWCAGAECFQNCETAHQPADWKKYTLLDFCRILGLKIDDKDVAGQVVSKSQVTIQGVSGCIFKKRRIFRRDFNRP